MLRATRIGQLADSLYFLGFLWTLWALIDAFVVHQLSIAEAVFRTFGYALVTTATGMFLRLLLLQFQYSEEDQVQMGQLGMEEEIARFTGELRAASGEVNAFRSKTGPALDGWISSLNKSATGLSIAVQEVRTQTGSLKDALVDVHRQSADQISNVVANAVNAFTGKLKPSLDSLNSANKQFVDSVQKSTVDLQDRLEGDTAILGEKLEAGSAKVQTAVNAGEGQIQATLQANAGQLHTVSPERAKRSVPVWSKARKRSMMQ